MNAKCKEVYLGSSTVKKGNEIEISLVDTLYLQFKTFHLGKTLLNSPHS